MSTTLNPLQLVSPVITGTVVSVDGGVLPLTFLATATNTGEKPNTLTLIWDGSTITLSNPVTTGNTATFSTTLKVGLGEYPLQVQGHSALGNVTPLFVINVLGLTPVNEPAVTGPGGVTVKRGMDACVVEWSTPTDPGFLGVRVQWSTDYTGLTVPYTQFGDLVSAVSRSAKSEMVTSTHTVSSTDGTTQVTTTTSLVTLLEFSQVKFAATDVGNAQQFYVVLSTVVNDPVTNLVFESNYNGPFSCSFVDLRSVTPSDFPYMQNQSDIAGRMISEVLQVYPDIDLTPRSEVRDIWVDPLAIELSEVSVREWFARCSRSCAAMLAIDDVNSTGFSDPVTSSPVKQQLARAWYLSFSDTQALIDRQFDILADDSGLTRGPATAATCPLTIYTYSKPLATATIPAGSLVSTVPDSETASVQFRTMTDVTFNIGSLSSYWDPVHSWWAVTVPVQCQVTGSIGNVGASTIRQIVSGVPSTFSVTNLVASDFGSDKESNRSLAERTQDRKITGVDTGTRKGYLGTARSIPGVTQARVVASGDAEMLRDWDQDQRKHIYGTVDVYVRGMSPGQQTTLRPYEYSNNADFQDYANYLPLTRSASQDQRGNTVYSFRFPTSALPSTPIGVLELATTIPGSGNYLYFGVANAVVDPTGAVWLDMTELAYTYTGTGATLARVTVPVSNTNPTPRTNGQLLSSLGGQYSYLADFRLTTNISFSPTLQPVTNLQSCVGNGPSGSLPTSAFSVVVTQDPLLLGGSNEAGDVVNVSLAGTVPVTTNMIFTTASPATGLSLGSNVAVTIQPDGTVGDLVSVISEDGLTKYVWNVDYKVVPTGPYRTFSIQRIPTGSIPVIGPSDNSFGKTINVTYNKYQYAEQVSLVSENLSLHGAAYTPCTRPGFVGNIWLPNSYGFTQLTSDPALVAAGVWLNNRIMKVTYNNGTTNVVMINGVDYAYAVDPASNTLSLARILSGSIPDGATVSVTYFTTEVFSVLTQYPAVVEAVASAIEQTRHAAADVVVKALVGNSVDVAMTVELESTMTPDIIDPKIRTIISTALDQTQSKLSQSEVIRQVQSLAGVRSIKIPLTKFAKSDGSYDVGHVIPTGTPWTPIAQDPRFNNLRVPTKTFISTKPVLPNSTKPSGGDKGSYVGLLYEGFAFQRLFSPREFASAQVPSFYIIGMNDILDGSISWNPNDVGRVILNLPDVTTLDKQMTTPSAYPFRCTYQIWYEGGYQDLSISSSEYLKPGKITLDYILNTNSANIS